MATPSGLSAQFGFKAETTYGTAVVVDRFQPIIDEGVESTFEALEAESIIAGAHVLRSEQWTQGVWRHEGPVGMELTTRNCGLLLHHALGGITTTSLAGTSTHVMSVSDQTGLSLTMQIGRPDRGGTVRPFTYAGGKIAGAEIAVEAGKNATIGLDVVAQTVTTATGLAAVSYTTTSYPFSFASGSFTLATSSLCVRSARIAWDNALDKDRLCIGQSYIDQPLNGDRREITGEVELEFPDLVHWQRFVNGTEGNLTLALVNGTRSLTIAANVRTDKASPNVSGRGLIVKTMSFKATGTNSDASALSMTYVTTDTTP